MCVMKGNDDYWKIISAGCKHSLLDYEHFLDMTSCTTRWRGDKVPDKIGTMKLPHAVTLLPQHEHLVWGRLLCNVPVSPGSTVIVEPCTSKTRPRDILVGWVITPMWGNWWVPMKMTNVSSKPRLLMYHLALQWKTSTSSGAPVRWRTGSQNRSLGQLLQMLTSNTGSPIYD